MNKNSLKAYMGYSNYESHWEWAILIFAHNIKAAKKIGWQYADLDDWTDFRVKMIEKFLSPYIFPLANQEMLLKNTPHVVVDIPCCESCNLWGVIVNKDGTCGNCGSYVGDVLGKLFNDQ